MHSSFRLFFYLQVLGYKWPPWIYTHEVFLLVACFLVCFVLIVHKLIISRACFPWGGGPTCPWLYLWSSLKLASAGDPKVFLWSQMRLLINVPGSVSMTPGFTPEHSAALCSGPLFFPTLGLGAWQVFLPLSQTSKQHSPP